MILVTGAGGQLGRELVELAAAVGAVADVTGLARAALDVTDAGAVATALARPGLRCVINAAAWTDVDGAERDPAAAFAVNRDGAALLAAACADAGLPLLQVSTDHVFDGRPGRPWREDDAVSPLGVYGHSKAAGEAAIRARLPAHLILRTSWVFGRYGGNFVKTVLRRARAGEALDIVGDHAGGPTPARDLAAALLVLARRAASGAALPWGTWHFAGQPFLSRHAFAAAILEGARQRGLLPAPVLLRAIPSSAWADAALRPANACLDSARTAAALGIAVPDWRAGLEALLDTLADTRGQDLMLPPMPSGAP